MNADSMNEDMHSKEDEAFIQASRSELEKSAADVDALTAARLKAMRMRALDEVGRGFHLPVWLPSAGVAAALALAVSSWMLVQGPGTTVASDDAYEMLAADPHELIGNHDFYEWLDAQYEAGNAPELDQI